MFAENDPGVPINGIQVANATTKGLVPTPPNNTSTYLRGDGTWAAIPSMELPNVVLVGKSLGNGTAITAVVALGVATVTHATHGYTTGDSIIISGGTIVSGNIGDFNQLHVITGTTTNTYTFNTTCSTGTIGGSPVEMFWFKGTRTTNPTLIKNVTRSGGGFVKVAFSNTQPDAFYGANGFAASAAVSNLFTATDNSNTNTTTTFGFLFADAGGTGHDALSYLFLSFTGII